MARTLEPTAAQRTATPAARSIVDLDGISKRFGTFTALHPLTLAIAQGEFFALLGSSGSGKTTTLRIIAGFEQPDSGRVLLVGRDVTAAPPYERDVNTVFQDYALFPHMSVWDNIAYGLRARRVAKPEVARRVDEMLGMVRLSEFGARKPAQLSGGQRQRVAPARRARPRTTACAVSCARVCSPAPACATTCRSARTSGRSSSQTPAPSAAPRRATPPSSPVYYSAIASSHNELYNWQASRRPQKRGWL